jgi:predicted DNA-binding transcriptional regulator AlpA
MYEVAHITGLQLNIIHQYINEGHFPVPVSFGETTSEWLWVDTEIQIWIADIISERDYEMNEHLVNGDKETSIIPTYKKMEWEYIHGRCLPAKVY